jgi:hypothetical protein
MSRRPGLLISGAVGVAGVIALGVYPQPYMDAVVNASHRPQAVHRSSIIEASLILASPPMLFSSPQSVRKNVTP